MLAAVALYYALIPVIGPHYAKVCSKGEYGPPDHCESWDIVSAFIRRLFIGLDEHNGLVAAFAGVAVAVFTGVLWRSTDNLWKAGVEQARLMRETFDAEHRPWLAVRTPTIESVSFYGDQIAVRVSFPIENVGNTPATEVLLWGNIIGFCDQTTVLDKINHSVSQYDLYKGSYVADDIPAQVYFPGEERPYKTEIVEKTAVFSKIGNGSYLADILVIYAVCYKSPRDRTTRHSSGVYAVYINEACPMIPEDVTGFGPFTGDQVRAQPWIRGFLAT